MIDPKASFQTTAYMVIFNAPDRKPVTVLSFADPVRALSSVSRIYGPGVLCIVPALEYQREQTEARNAMLLGNYDSLHPTAEGRARLSAGLRDMKHWGVAPAKPAFLTRVRRFVCSRAFVAAVLVGAAFAHSIFWSL